jgi:toxin-antitoxin system PIN domain toxin
LFVVDHEHHLATVQWFEELKAGEAGMCRAVQATLLRLLGSRQVVGSGALTLAQAWIRIEQALEDERVMFLHEPMGLDAAWPTLFRYDWPTPNLAQDSYLAAFAIANGCKLVTRDRGFLEFRGLDVELL